jgi:hypothetical protein
VKGAVPHDVEFTDTSEEAIQRDLAFFSQWQPPDGFDFKGLLGICGRVGSVATEPQIVTNAKGSFPNAGQTAVLLPDQAHRALSVRERC